MPPKDRVVYDIGSKMMGYSDAVAFKFNPCENTQDLEDVFERLRSDNVRFSITVYGDDVTVCVDGEDTIGQDPIGTFLYAVWLRYCQN